MGGQPLREDDEASLIAVPSRAEGGRIFARIAAGAGVAIGIGALHRGATADFLCGLGGEGPLEEITFTTPGLWSAPGLTVVRLTLGLLVVVAAVVFVRSTRTPIRVVAGILGAAAGIAASGVFGRFDLWGMIPSELRPGSPDACILGGDLGASKQDLGNVLMAVGGLAAAFFGVLGLLRVQSGTASPTGIRDRTILKIVLIVLGAIALLLALLILMLLPQMDETL